MHKHRYVIQRKAWENAVNGRHEEGIEQLSRLLQKVPNDPQTHLQLADLLFYAGRYSQAESHYQEAKKNSPSSAKPDYGLAVLWLNQDRRQEAILALREAGMKDESYERDVANALLAYYDGDFINAIGRFLDAERWINMVKEQDQVFMRDQRAWLYAKIGESYSQVGDFASAVIWLKAATVSGRPTPEMFYNLGRALLRERKLEAAADAITRAIIDNPNFNKAHMLMAKIAIQRGKLLSAVAYLVKAFKSRRR